MMVEVRVGLEHVEVNHSHLPQGGRDHTLGSGR